VASRPTGVDAIVTNPPYGRLATPFIRHALSLDVPIVAMLLRVDFDSAKTRRDLFADCPYFAGKITLLDRIA
jgi:tRNA G10  N-methylase Trm11